MSQDEQQPNEQPDEVEEVDDNTTIWESLSEPQRKLFDGQTMRVVNMLGLLSKPEHQFKILTLADIFLMPILLQIFSDTKYREQEQVATDTFIHDFGELCADALEDAKVEQWAETILENQDFAFLAKVLLYIAVDGCIQSEEHLRSMNAKVRRHDKRTKK